MSERVGRKFSALAARQHGVVAVWQLLDAGFRRSQVDRWLRTAKPPKVHWGVYGNPGPLGMYMAAALAFGREAAISHLSGVELWGMRDREEGPIHVSVPSRAGRGPRDGFVVHRPARVLKVKRHGIPVMTPTRCLLDADLPRHALYRALEQADREWLPVDRPALPHEDVVALQAVVKGTTRSDAEARFLLLCHDRGLELPLVNHVLNGFESDFHWPGHRLVVEVDGWEFHGDRRQFETDRWRGLVHRAAGYEVVRASALQVEHEPELVTAAVLAAAPRLRPRRRRRQRPWSTTSTLVPSGARTKAA